MSEQVVLSLVALAQAVVVGALGVIGSIVVAKINKVQRDARATKDSVVNHHGTNLRDDIDLIRDESRRHMRSQSHIQFEQGMQLNELLELGVENRRRISALESTEIIRKGKHDD